MKMFLALLFSFFRLGIEPPIEDEDEPQVELELESETPAEEEIPEPIPDEDDSIDPKRELTAAQAAAKAERERADRYERELAEARRQSETRFAAQRPQEDEVTREENVKLSDPKTSELEKWQIQANRQLRQGRSESQMALAQAHDVADKTAFANIAVTSPALYKRYAARVEEQLAAMRAKGYNAPRETILDNMIGKDAREGKLTKKAKPAAAAGTVARGKLPGVRSDVSGRGKMTEHQKREQRLLNVAI